VLNFCTESGKLHKNSITTKIISVQRRQNPRFFHCRQLGRDIHIVRVLMKQYTVFNNER